METEGNPWCFYTSGITANYVALSPGFAYSFYSGDNFAFTIIKYQMLWNLTLFMHVCENLLGYLLELHGYVRCRRVSHASLHVSI